MSGKLKAVILLGLLYGLGLISGFAWQRYCFHRWPMRPGLYAEHRVERLKRKLNLTPDQETAIKAIFQKILAILCKLLCDFLKDFRVFLKFRKIYRNFSNLKQENTELKKELEKIKENFIKHEQEYQNLQVIGLKK